jgi:RNA polymerase sigma factor (sigma-70 family)
VNVSPVALVDLFARVRAGDAAARRQLFDLLSRSGHFTATLRRMARAALANFREARRLLDTDDLVQSSLAVGMATCSRFKGKTTGEFLVWLQRIVRGRLDRLMRRLGGTARSWEDLDGFPDEALDAAAALVEKDLRDCLARLVASLPSNERLVIELKLARFTVRQIARLLKLKPATVRKRESRAVRRLRLWLK